MMDSLDTCVIIKMTKTGAYVWPLRLATSSDVDPSYYYCGFGFDGCTLFVIWIDYRGRPQMCYNQPERVNW